MFVRHLKALGLSLLVSLVASISSGAAGQPPVLPKTFGGWVLDAPRESSGAALAGELGDNFAILVESGLISSQSGTFSRAASGEKGGGSASMAVRLYRFRDAPGAYSAYTFLRTADMSSSDLTEKSAVGRERILAVVGSLLLQLSAPGAASLSELKTLVTLLQQQTAPGAYPTLWQYLPAEGFERTSDHYLMGPAALSRVLPFAEGDWLGFAQGVEAESARYQLGRDSLTLLLAVYPTPQLARAKLQDLQQRLGVKPADAATPPRGTVIDLVRPGPAPALYAERRGLMITILAGAHDARVARAMFDRVQYETAVTWNEPSWEAKEPPFIVMLINILIATCLLLLYAFIAGLVFAVVRLAVKRLVPGRIFDRDKDIELIQLGLGSKPIEAKDFLSPRSHD
ncbi:MAG TPA: DUF6599 family protein [Terriglobales bacterium]|nr:DUF6599 family protein [Terriglobales bacterium]